MRFQLEVLLRAEDVSDEEPGTERQLTATVTAGSPTAARRKVIHNAQQTGYLVSRILTIEEAPR